jgi:hypothetical protein
MKLFLGLGHLHLAVDGQEVGLNPTVELQGMCDRRGLWAGFSHSSIGPQLWKAAVAWILAGGSLSHCVLLRSTTTLSESHAWMHRADISSQRLHGTVSVPKWPSDAIF